ncbi:hypothetical protein LUZ60_006604 [Juncus effusus]|nr:hypothetical protein LUZ60_006604 [Juncus effusus]
MDSSCTLIFLATLIGLLSCGAKKDLMRDRYEEWLSRYGKTYQDSHQKEERYRIYEANVELIDAFNAVNQGYKLTDNKFADLTNIEFRKKILRLHAKPLIMESNENQAQSERVRDLLQDELPESIDWREKGAVTKVKDQRNCGSCWAFAAVAAIEGLNQIKSGKLIPLSEQELVDCDTIGTNKGCLGGFMSDAYDFISQNGGLTSESDYPYIGSQNNCSCAKLSHHVAAIKGYANVSTNSEQSLIQAVAAQPVSVGIDAGSFVFQFYSAGIFTGPCGTDLNHGVAVVGYGTDGTEKYWTVKNSWGEEWGEKGFVRMKRNVTDNEKGICGIAMLGSYPLI